MENDEISNKFKIITSLVAGGLSGALAKTAIAPLDRTKIHFQITPFKQYSLKGAIRFIIVSLETHGALSLWRGNSATMVRIVPYAAVQFSAHEQWKLFLRVDDNNINKDKLKRFIAGSLAGVTAQTCTYPLDLTRACMAVTHRKEYSSLRKIFSRIFKQKGVIGMYRGYIPTILGSIPYSGTSFFVYETLKLKYTNFQKKSLNPIERMACGAIAGMAGQSSSYPLDIIRRRMQTAVVHGNEHLYPTIAKTVLKIYRDEGIIKGFYKGLSMNWIKGPIAVGISFTTYDTAENFLRNIPVLKNR